MLVWYDKGGTFQDLVEEAVPESFQLLKFEGSYLTIRTKIEREKDFAKRRVIYVPEAPPSPTWLRDYEFFGARTDLTLSALISQIYMVKLTKNLKAILTPQNCRRLAGKWNEVLGAVETPLSEERLKEALLAVAFGHLHPFDVKRAILVYLTYPEDISKDLVASGLIETFTEILQRKYGLKCPKGKIIRARDLAATVLLTEFVKNSGGLAEEEFGDILPEKGRWGFWADLASIWSSSIEFRDSFIQWSGHIEKEYNILEKIKGENRIERVLSFRAVDNALLNEVKARIEGGELEGILKNADYIKRVAKIRSDFVWTHIGILKEWKVLSASIDLLRLIQDSFHKVGEKVNARFLVKNYTADEGWWRIDNLYRQLASLDIDLDPEVRKLFIQLPGRRYQEWLRVIGNKFSAAFDGKETWHVDEALDQEAFWKEFIHLPDERTAIFFIDAMRYELQKRIVTKFKKSGLRVGHRVMLSSLPSITKVGMACLLPHEKVSVQIKDGELQVLLDGEKVSTKADRQEWLRSKYGDQVALVELDVLKDPKALARNTKGARLLVVMDREIDRAGSFISGELLDDFDKLSDRVKRGVDVAIQAGYDKVLVTTDHGFLFLPKPDKLETLKSVSSGSDIASGRRYAMGHPPRVKGTFSFSLKSLGFEGESLQALFPRGIAQFPSPGPKEAFIHGGVSLQECCIGVLEIKAGEAVGEKVDVKVLLPDLITSAIFTVGFQPIPRRLVVIPRKLIVEIYVDEKMMIRSDPVELSYEKEHLTLRLPKIPKYIEVRVKDLDTQEILSKKGIPVVLEGYDEFI
ncbi:hypothetical protein ES703_73242 [subsurface metagenome]